MCDIQCLAHLSRTHRIQDETEADQDVSGVLDVTVDVWRCYSLTIRASAARKARARNAWTGNVWLDHAHREPHTIHSHRVRALDSFLSAVCARQARQ